MSEPVYLDTAALVKLVVPEPESAFFAGLVDGQEDIWSSELALTETYAALLRKEREAAVSRAQRVAAWTEIQSKVAEGSLQLVPLTRRLLDAANSLLERCHPAVSLRSLDAIHLASFQECRSEPLVTNDRVLRAAAARLGMALAPLPEDPSSPPG